MDGSVYPMDFVNDSYFVRELPEPFDLIHRLGGLLDWEGGPRWYNEPAMTDFYRPRGTFGPPGSGGSGGSFLALNSAADKPGMASITTHAGADPDNIFTGVASYNEQAGVAPETRLSFCYTPCTFIRCFNRDKQGVSSK